METNELVKKGTTTVGIVCKDGIVLGADRRATAGNLIVNKKISKLYWIDDNMVITMAGTVSDAQLLSKLAKAEIALKRIRTGIMPSVKESANMLAGLVYSNIRKMSMIPGVSHFLLGGKDNEGFKLYDLFADGSLTDVDDFICSGSGSVMAYGVLETLYVPGISVADGIKLVVKAINAAMQRDNASGGGIEVVSITADGAKKVVEKEIKEKVEL